MKNGNGNPRLRIYVDLMSAAVGLSGAAWEIFYDHSQNKYVYLLIIFLLRASTGIAERVLEVFGRR